MRLRQQPESLADRIWRHSNAAAIAGMIASEQADAKSWIKEMEEGK